MKIVMGPITLARPGWGLERGSVTTLVSNDAGGRPDVLAAQILCGAALQGVRVLMLLPLSREKDEAWRAMMTLLADDSVKSAARAMRNLPITMHTCGTGWDKAAKADLVYAPGIGTQDLRRLRSQTEAAILALGEGIDRQSSGRPVEIVRVGGTTLLLDSEGVEIPVVYDPSGPIYRPA